MRKTMTASSHVATWRSCAITRSPELHRAAELLNLFASERAEVSGWKPPELQRAERNSLEALDLGADPREQAPDLAVLALGERDGDEREIAASPVPHAFQDAHRVEARTFRAALRRTGVGAEHALRELRERFGRQHALHCDAVFLRNSGARVREAVSELAVVRKEHEPRRIRVEPADRIDALAGGYSLAHEVDDVDAPARVARSRDDALRLVEHEIEALARALAGASAQVDDFAVEFDQVARGFDEARQRRHAPAIDP